MCRHCSSQAHSSPESDRQVVAFSPFQCKKLNPAIEPKSIPNIPTSESGSECLHSSLDQIFPNDYSLFTQSTFFTPPVLNSTSQKPYSCSPKLPPQDLSMMISAIQSLRYNIPCMYSRLPNPTLNLPINSSI
ncbi:hypothetical protein O181_060864 [Austropuccinia psidii MF-1]|uniref:Uncharacterized protein n=1 Tax=Austropuccinia psidii MF-1 TaxID=1389203 RepID=A0A9Q3EH66_9BASI|nr:hypothetical protein [Austropuccinia psidii MF-1]